MWKNCSPVDKNTKCQGLLGVVSTLLSFCGIWYSRCQRNQTVEFWQILNYCGTVKVSDAAGTNWDSVYRVNKSLNICFTVFVICLGFL